MKIIKNKNNFTIYTDIIYNNYLEFLNLNKEIVFEITLQIFEDFKVSNKNYFIININSIVSELETNISIKIFKRNYDEILKKIMDYYRENENYEKCEVVKNLISFFENNSTK